mgnify:CR=1 FL=1
MKKLLILTELHQATSKLEILLNNQLKKLHFLKILVMGFENIQIIFNWHNGKLLPNTTLIKP